MEVNEDVITERIIRFLRMLPNGWAKKTHGSQFTSGDPDIVACVNGRAIQLEVKRRVGMTASPIQRAKLTQWERAGALVGVVASVEEVRALLEGAGIVTK